MTLYHLYFIQIKIVYHISILLLIRISDYDINIFSFRCFKNEELLFSVPVPVIVDSNIYNRLYCFEIVSKNELLISNSNLLSPLNVLASQK